MSMSLLEMLSTPEVIMSVEGRQFDIGNLIPKSMRGSSSEFDYEHEHQDEGEEQPAKQSRRSLKKSHRSRRASDSGREFDGNHSISSEHGAWIRRRATTRTRRPRRERPICTQTVRLYPKMDDLMSATVDSETIDSLFLRIPRRRLTIPGYEGFASSESSLDISFAPSTNSAFAACDKELDKKMKDCKSFEDLLADHDVTKRHSPPRGYTLRSRSSSPNVPSRFEQRSMEDDSEPASVSDSFADQSVYKSLPEVEVLPGVFMELRGAKETQCSIEEGVAICVECVCCEGTLQCVPDAEMIICQDCRVVSLVEVHGYNDSLITRRGVGLGLKIKTFDEMY